MRLNLPYLTAACILSSSFGAYSQSVNPQFVYVANRDSNTISGFRIDENSGALTSLGTVAGVFGPTFVKVDASGLTLYVGSAAGIGPIYVYRVNPSTGMLTSVTEGTIVTNSPPVDLALHSSGKYMYVAKGLGCSFEFCGEIVTYVRNDVGLWTELPGGRMSTEYTTDLVIDPTGRLLLAADANLGGFGGARHSIASFSIDQNTGKLTLVARSGGGQWPRPSITAHPSGRFFHVTQGDAVRGFTIKENGFTAVPQASPPSTGVDAYDLIPNPTGQFLYAVSRLDRSRPTAVGNVSAFRIDPDTGFVTEIGSASTGVEGWAGAIDRNGRFLYVATRNATVAGFRIDPGTGVLVAMASPAVPIMSHPSAIAVAGAPGYTIVPNRGGNAGQVTVKIFGGGFVPGTQLRLTGAGPDILEVNSAIIQPGSVLTATLNLVGAAPGIKTVLITYPDKTSLSLPNAFAVEQGGISELRIDVVGAQQFRGGRAMKLYVAVENTGKVDALMPIVQLTGIPLNSNLVSMKSFAIGNSVREKSSASLAANSSYSLDFDVVDSGGTVTSPSLWTNGGRQRFGFVPLTIAPGTAMLLGFELMIASDIVPGGQFIGSALVTRSFASYPSAAGKCAWALAENAWDEVRPFTNKCANALYQHYAEVAKSIYNLVQSSQPPGRVSVGDLRSFVATLLKEGMGLAAGECGVDQPRALKWAAKAFELFDLMMAGANTVIDCYDLLNGEFAASFVRTRVDSRDPNDKSGLFGVKRERFTSRATSIAYLVEFENKTTATAPAEIVLVTDQIDGARFDLNTVTLGSIVFGDKVVTPTSVPLNILGTYNTTVDLRPAKNLLVAIAVALNKTTGVLTWKFNSLDPATGQPPTGVDGFLAPGAGGSVLFTVRAKDGLPTGTQILNKASIVFDANAPILTPEWLNTIDATAPTSSVLAQSPTQTAIRFPVRWLGTDQGAGIDRYDVYQSQNNGPFTPWLSNNTTTQAQFTGVVGNTYCFYSIARDLVGNVETAKSTGESCTTVTSGTVPGDVNGDGVVNCTDFGMVRAALGKKLGHPSWDSKLDVVVDSVIDVRDLAYVSQRLPVGTRCQ